MRNPTLWRPLVGYRVVRVDRVATAQTACLAATKHVDLASVHGGGVATQTQRHRGTGAPWTIEVACAQVEKHRDVRYAEALRIVDQASRAEIRRDRLGAQAPNRGNEFADERA